MADLLTPSSLVPKSGIYSMHHSSGHAPATEAFIWKGMILPCCLQEGCDVTYMLVRGMQFHPLSGASK